MNDHDRSNLNFLLTASEKTIKEWSKVVDADDIEYAHELLAQYAEELRQRSAEIVVECEMESVLQKYNKYPEANRVIDQFRLTK